MDYRKMTFDGKEYNVLTDEELEDSRKLKEMGIRLYMQQVPTSKLEDLTSKI